MPHQGMSIEEALLIGELEYPDRTPTKKTYTLTLTIEVEAEAEYTKWLDEQLQSPVDITDQIADPENGPFNPEYNTWLDKDYFCDAPVNYAYGAWCEGPEIKAVITPMEETQK